MTANMLSKGFLASFPVAIKQAAQPFSGVILVAECVLLSCYVAAFVVLKI
jgi:hypothetical protein